MKITDYTPWFDTSLLHKKTHPDSFMYDPMEISTRTFLWQMKDPKYANTLHYKLEYISELYKKYIEEDACMTIRL